MIINPAIREQKSDAVLAHGNDKDAAGLTSTHPLIQDTWHKPTLSPTHICSDPCVCILYSSRLQQLEATLSWKGLIYHQNTQRLEADEYCRWWWRKCRDGRNWKNVKQMGIRFTRRGIPPVCGGCVGQGGTSGSTMAQTAGGATWTSKLCQNSQTIFPLWWKV